MWRTIATEQCEGNSVCSTGIYEDMRVYRAERASNHKVFLISGLEGTIRLSGLTFYMQ